MFEPEAVRRLVGRYCDAVTRFDPDQFGDTWAEDGVWHLPGGQEVRGRPDIVALYGDSRARFALCVQELLSSVIDPAGHARFTVRELQWPKDGEGSQLIGVYDDTYSGPPDAPRFASRRFTILYRGSADLSGRLFGPERLGPA